MESYIINVTFTKKRSNGIIIHDEDFIEKEFDDNDAAKEFIQEHYMNLLKQVNANTESLHEQICKKQIEFRLFHIVNDDTGEEDFLGVIPLPIKPVLELEW